VPVFVRFHERPDASGPSASTGSRTSTMGLSSARRRWSPDTLYRAAPPTLAGAAPAGDPPAAAGRELGERTYPRREG
jgi:hypothetical protein